jgi:tRNA pseudouridine55 synthase
MIIPVYKNIGQSTHLLAQSIGELTAKETKDESHLKATHTGTLDPMAEGIVVVLTGNDRFKKEDYSNWKKEYEFNILFGISTESNYLLCLKTEIKKNQLNLEKTVKNTQKILNDFTGTFEQIQPDFSAQRIDGKSAFDKAKDGETIQNKKNNITVFSLEFVNSTTITPKDLLELIQKKINSVHGDFRQDTIIANWKQTVEELKLHKIDQLTLIHLKAVVSKRTYIRSLVRDIAKKLGVFATTFHITRTKNGKFTKKECKSFC